MKEVVTSLVKKFYKSEFSVNVFKLFTGTSIAQLIGIALAPVLYRLYEPESFGVFALFVAVSSVLGTFSTFQYVQLVLLERKNDYAFNAATACAKVPLITARGLDTTTAKRP